ncbi:MAG TPA: hypothetical protein VFR07_17650 [Mycobacteriales bacterium]|jgi:hypothetical protein|nr:hypothetical protein [Mycobacteriales bacterium]
MAVISRTGHTYQTTDLTTGKRRDFLDEARAGVARLREPDGNSLSMLPSEDLDLLLAIRGHSLSYLALETTLTRPREQRRATDFGELAWAAALDDDDLEGFRDEFRDSLALSIASLSETPVSETLKGWRLTARLLALPDAADRLDTAGPDEEWSDVARPGHETEA